MRLLSLLFVMLVGCSSLHRQNFPDATPPPSWTTPEGRTKARLDLASSLLEIGRHEEALEVLRVAREESGPDLEIDLLQARLYMAEGLLTEAEALLRPHLSSEKRDPALQAVLGLLWFDLGRLDDAEMALRRAVDLVPQDPAVHNNLGFLLLVRNQPEEALNEFRESLRQDPTSLRARNNQGYALVALGKDDDALASFRAVGTEDAALASMGMALERQGARDRAITYYQNALLLVPDQIVALEGLKRLSPPEAP